MAQVVPGSARSWAPCWRAGVPAGTTLTRSRYSELLRHALFYLAAGGASTLLQACLYLLLRATLGAQAANLVAIALTTIANTEFHRLVTFAGRKAKPARRHVQTVLTFAFYAGTGSVALAGLRAAVSTPTPATETALLVSVSTVGGIVRFLLLRSWVFAGGTRMVR